MGNLFIDKVNSFFNQPINARNGTAASNSKDYKKEIIDGLSAVLKPLGYKRKGNVYTLDVNDLTHFISLQSSQSSTAQQLKVTVNIEMASGTLAAFRDNRLPIEWYRTSQERIGIYTNEKKDIWWVINNLSEATVASQQINDILLKKVIPELETLKSTDDLIAFWKAGNCRGITDKQRKYYLEVLGVLVDIDL